MNVLDEILSTVVAMAADVQLLKSRTMNHKPERQRYGWNVPQVAKRLNWAEQTVRKNCHLRKMPFSKRGGRLYFDEQEIDAWMQAGRRATAAEVAEDRMIGKNEKAQRA